MPELSNQLNVIHPWGMPFHYLINTHNKMVLCIIYILLCIYCSQDNYLRSSCTLNSWESKKECKQMKIYWRFQQLGRLNSNNKQSIVRIYNWEHKYAHIFHKEKCVGRTVHILLIHQTSSNMWELLSQEGMLCSYHLMCTTNNQKQLMSWSNTTCFLGQSWFHQHW